MKVHLPCVVQKVRRPHSVLISLFTVLHSMQYGLGYRKAVSPYILILTLPVCYFNTDNN